MLPTIISFPTFSCGSKNLPDRLKKKYGKISADIFQYFKNPCGSLIIMHNISLMKNLENVLYVIHFVNCLNKYMCT